MKFLELNNIIKTNILFSKLQSFDPRRTLEIEVYSCKQTKQQKKHRIIRKPLRFYVSALEMAFPDHDFSSESIRSFNKSSGQELKGELSFVFFTLYKNHSDVAELVQYLDNLLEQCVDVRHSVFYTLNKSILCDSDYHKVFLIHDKKSKRVVIIKSIQQQRE